MWLYPFAAELFGEVIEPPGPIVMSESSISLAGPSVITPTCPDFSNPTDNMDPSCDNPGDFSDNDGLIVSVTMGALLLTLAVVGVPLLVIMVIKMRKKCKQRTAAVVPTDDSSSG